MRTALFLLAGLLLVSASFILGRLFVGSYARAGLCATVLCVAVWLVLTGANLYAGVTRAGYTLTEELPIFLLLFVVPALVMMFLRWRFL